MKYVIFLSLLIFSINLNGQDFSQAYPKKKKTHNFLDKNFSQISWVKWRLSTPFRTGKLPIQGADYKRIKVELITESKDNELENFLDITHGDITKRIKVDFNSTSFSDYLERDLNLLLNEIIKFDYKYTVVHENVWDSKTKVVFVTSEEYKQLKESNLIMDEVILTIN